IESGELDFAIYRPEEYQFLQLRHSKVKISSKTVKNPMIAIANYFFDTIRQDAFQIDEGVLKESRINLWRNFSDEVKPTDPVKVGQLGYNYNHHVIDDHYYEDEAYNDILRYYRDNFFKASIIFPLGALDCVKNLLQMSNNNLVLISSDKGFTDMEYMLGHRNAEFALHDGAFSYMVNYNAIRRYFDQLGGVSFYSSDKNLDLNTQVNVLMAKAPEKKFEELRYYFSEKIERFNPINYLYTLQGVIFEEFREIPQDTTFRLSAFLAYFRLNLCDPSTFCRFAPQLFALLEDISFVQRVELLKIMNKTWENYYQFGGESNLPFWIAQVLYGLGLYEKSLAFFEKTNQSGTDTKHEVCFYFMGKCNENLANLREAQRYYLACLEKCPDFGPAREALIDVEIVLRERTTLHDILKI
ncbi:MAG: CDC27 family protein, partial [Cyanobacteria bacterium]|nr:CDC27 family protein [Cyanobacteriota bacterium]